MGFTEVSVIWAGALDESATFGDNETDAMETFVAGVQRDASETTDAVEIYALRHDHASDVDDCACMQYVTDHSPLWTNGK